MKPKATTAVLLVIIFGVVGYTVFNVFKEPERRRPRRPPGMEQTVAVHGLISPENDFARDGETLGILRDRYGVELTTETRESSQMATADLSGLDFVWPADEIALGEFRHNRPGATGATTFRSPLVIYTWDVVADALVRAGVAKSDRAGCFTVDVRKLADMEAHGTRWRSLGLAEMPGCVEVAVTDPVHSACGRIWCALVASAEIGHDLADPKRLNAALPALRRSCRGAQVRSGNAQSLFEEFVKGGPERRPLAIGYEAEYIQHRMGFGAPTYGLKHAIRILYPDPSIWTAHTLVPLTGNGRRLLTALDDPHLQSSSRGKYGFRTAAGAGSMYQSSGMQGVPMTIDHSVEVPTPAEVKAIEDSLR
ncbi:MAG TPA: hypothetical protein VKT77_11430 [Chthonomonadaceae bacterium]|nr:hypothetical protein [Chthonomonadaceae bacterium]